MVGSILRSAVYAGALALLTTLVPSQLVSQGTQSAIIGTVSDVSGAIVPGAAVKARNQLTGVIWTTKSGPNGEYSFPFLPTGAYEISVELAGFKTYTRIDVGLQTAQVVRVDAALEPGQLGEVVSVTAGGAPLVTTDTAALSSSMNSRQVQALPLGNRMFMQALALASGVANVNPNTTGTLRINGGTRLSNNFYMDGVNIKDRVRGEYTHSLESGPSLEALEEVNLKTSTSSTDTGFGTSEMQLTTKSGTNELHGSLFYYYRGTFAQARNFFNRTDTLPKLVQNTYGGSLGGPIIKNRTFYFFTYEGLELRQGSASTVTVPTQQMQRGDFSQLSTPIRDIFSANTVAGQAVFPNNIIPSSRIDPTALKVLDLFGYPTPNQDGLVSNFFGAPPQPRYFRQVVGRLDHRLTNADNLSVRLWRGWMEQYVAQAPIDSYGTGILTQPTTNVSASHVHSFGAAQANELRFGYNDYPRKIALLSDRRNAYETLGIAGVPIVDPELQGPGPRFNFTGAGSALFIGENANWPQVLGTELFQLSDTFSMIRGKHEVRIGGQFTHSRIPFFSTPNTRGQITYQGSNSPVSTGNAFANFLLGAPTAASLSTSHAVRQLRDRWYGAFVDDTWRAARNLTVTLGLRYEYMTPLYEANDLGLAGFDVASRSIAINSPSIPDDLPRVVGSGAGIPVVTTRSLDLGRALRNPDKNNFAPRVGLAWRPFGNNTSVLRGGYGVFYSSDESILFQGVATRNQPWVFSRDFASDVGRRLTTNQPFVAGSLQNPSITSIDRELKNPYIQQWNLTAEQQIAPDTALRISYVGSKGTGLWQPLDVNQAFSTGRSASGQVTSVRPFSELNSIPTTYSISNSVYHSLQTEVRRRWSAGLELQGNWTWAKSIDNFLDNGIPENSRDLGRERGNSDQLPTHSVNVNTILQLPFGRGRRFLGNSGGIVDGVFGGWQISGLGRWTNNGGFITPTYSNQLAAFGVGGNRPNVVPGVDAHATTSDEIFFNPAAFTAPTYNPDNPSIIYGNAGRGILETPGIFNLDLSVMKSFRIIEGHALQVRVDAFNATNHTNFQVFRIGTNISDVNAFGRATGAHPSRLMQWSLRYAF